MQTHQFKLLSGPEVEITKMVGKHQRWMNEEDGKDITDVIVDITKRIGSVTDRDKIARIIKGDPMLSNNPKGEGMLSHDFSEILLQARFLTCDREFLKRQEAMAIEDEIKREEALSLIPSHDLEFTYKWRHKQKDMETDLALCGLVIEDFKRHPYGFQCEEYEDVFKNYEQTVRMVDLGCDVKFNLMTTFREKRLLAAMKKSNDEIGAFDTLLGRNLRKAVKTENDTVFHSVSKKDLDNWSWSDLDDLQAEITAKEASIDSIYGFDVEDAPGGVLRIDLLMTKAFLFPSEARRGR